MKKFTMLFITVFIVGLLGSTQVHAQKNGQYVLDDNGYHITIVDENGNAKLVDVATKDVPWIVRFNPSSTLAGIVDKRTSVLRRYKRAAVGTGLAAATLLSAYNTRKNNQNRAERSNQLNEKRSKFDAKCHAAGVLGLGTNFSLISVMFSPFSPLVELGAAILGGAVLPLANAGLATVFKNSMDKHTQHLDRNLQLNVMETAGFNVDPYTLSNFKD